MNRKLMKVIAIVSGLCSLTTLNGMTVGAVKNNWDSEWTGGSGYCNTQYGGIHSYCSSKNDGGGRNRACCIRDKGDTSSIYVYNKSSKAAIVKVWGENGIIYLAKYDTTWCDGYTNISTNKWSVPKKSQRFIPQYIGERGFTYAHVHFDTTGTNGLWSADSSGWYPNADPKYN